MQKKIFSACKRPILTGEEQKSRRVFLGRILVRSNVCKIFVSAEVVTLRSPEENLQRLTIAPGKYLL